MPLTTKELGVIEDAMNHEQVLVKKFRSYANSAKDPAIKQQAEHLADRHQQHFNTLMGHLK